MFRLLRYFSITSCISIAAAAIALGVLGRNTALQNLLDAGEAHNIALTRAFSNSLWPSYREFLRSTSALTPEELQAHPTIMRLRQDVVALMKGTSVVKVKIYDLTGRTVFSTESRQLGEDKSGNAGFRGARSGVAKSELTHRNTFSAFEQTIEDRDLLSSYIPIRTLSGELEAVFELYDDVTELLATVHRAQRKITAVVLLVLGVLYGVLFLLVGHGDRLIRKGYEAEREIREQLKISESRYRELFEKAIDIVYLHDLEGKILAINEAGVRAGGYTREEFLQMNVAQLIAPEDLARQTELVSRMI